MASPCFIWVCFSVQRIQKKINGHKIMAYLKRWGRNNLASLRLRVLIDELPYPDMYLIKNCLQKLKSANLLLNWGAAHRAASSAPQLLHHRSRGSCAVALSSICGDIGSPRSCWEQSSQKPFGLSSSVLLAKRLKVGVNCVSWFRLQSTRRENGFPAFKPGRFVCFIFFLYCKNGLNPQSHSSEL